VYISCTPDTLARDCVTLAAAGYQLGEVTPVDLFPCTGHVESVVCLSREKADDYVRISVCTKDLKVTKGS
jgi:23S rRNA (uracil1939-C5)-methyltransferase